MNNRMRMYNCSWQWAPRERKPAKTAFSPGPSPLEKFLGGAARAQGAGSDGCFNRKLRERLT